MSRELEYIPPLFGDAFDKQADYAKALLFIWTAGPLSALLIIYLVGSFTAGTTNPSEWTADSRSWAVLPWLILSALIVGVGLAMLDDLTSAAKQALFWYENDEAKSKTIIALNEKTTVLEARIVELEDDLVKAKAGRRASIAR